LDRLVAHHSGFSDPCTDTQFQGEPHQWVAKYMADGKILQFSTEIAIYL